MWHSSDLENECLANARVGLSSLGAHCTEAGQLAQKLSCLGEAAPGQAMHLVAGQSWTRKRTHLICPILLVRIRTSAVSSNMRFAAAAVRRGLMTRRSCSVHVHTNSQQGMRHQHTTTHNAPDWLESNSPTRNSNHTVVSDPLYRPREKAYLDTSRRSSCAEDSEPCHKPLAHKHTTWSDAGFLLALTTPLMVRMMNAMAWRVYVVSFFCSASKSCEQRHQLTRPEHCTLTGQHGRTLSKALVSVNALCTSGPDGFARYRCTSSSVSKFMYACLPWFWADA